MKILSRIAGAVLSASAFIASDSFAQSQSQPLCIYNSAQYSEGALVCAHKSLMLTCHVDGAKATWKVSTDKDLNDRCTASAAPVVRESRRARRQMVRAQVVRPADPNAKCFNFNGKRYCE